jgi:hypothetical protein
MEMYKNSKKVAEMNIDRLSSEQVFKLLEIQIKYLGRHVIIDGVPIVDNPRHESVSAP